MPIGVIVNVSMVMPVSYLWSTYILPLVRGCNGKDYSVVKAA